MTKSILIVLVLIFSLNNCFSQLSKPEYVTVVEYFVDCIKKSDIEKLDSLISYPIERPYPVPPINNKQDFIKRYTEIFDDSLTSLITNSNIKEDWKDMGWRGIMLHNGIVWLDYNGKFLTTNYSSEKEKTIEKNWIENERNLLHTSLKKFNKPIHTLETDKFIIRVDLLENKEYRYASWSKEFDISQKPDLVINNGEKTYNGSGGNHYFIFTNGMYSYSVYVNNMRDNVTPQFNIKVTKNGKDILNQPAVLKELK